MTIKRTFIAEVETVYHKDYQCDYYRGFIMDGKNKIVERCKEMHPDYDEAYKKAKEDAERLKTVFIYDPGEGNRWEYVHDHGLYRFRYVKQNKSAALTAMRLSQTLIGQILSAAFDRVTIQYRKYGNLRNDFRNREHKKHFCETKMAMF